MHSLLGSIVTPAVIASLFALVFNARAEKHREVRKAILDRLQESRALVSEAVHTAAAYFSRSFKERTPELEAALWLVEREVRLNLSSLAERTVPHMQRELVALQRDFDFFVRELTGSNFQGKDAKVDLAHVRKIAALGADLRLSLSRVHFAELKLALERDPLDRVLKFLEVGDHYIPLADRLSEDQQITHLPDEEIGTKPPPP